MGFLLNICIKSTRSSENSLFTLINKLIRLFRSCLCLFSSEHQGRGCNKVINPLSPLSMFLYQLWNGFSCTDCIVQKSFMQLLWWSWTIHAQVATIETTENISYSTFLKCNLNVDGKRVLSFFNGLCPWFKLKVYLEYVWNPIFITSNFSKLIYKAQQRKQKKILQTADKRLTPQYCHANKISTISCIKPTASGLYYRSVIQDKCYNSWGNVHDIKL